MHIVGAIHRTISLCLAWCARRAVCIIMAAALRDSSVSQRRQCALMCTRPTPPHSLSHHTFNHPQELCCVCEISLCTLRGSIHPSIQKHAVPNYICTSATAVHTHACAYILMMMVYFGIFQSGMVMRTCKQESAAISCSF